VLLNGQWLYGQMELTGGFSVKNWSRFHMPRSSDCSGKWLWGDNKKSRDLQKSAPILSVAQQPEEVWTNEDDRWIQRAKLV